MNVHVKTGDTVVILSGKDKGKKGKVLAVSPKEGKVIVEGCNMIKKHVKPRRMGEQGGIVDAEGAMYASKVMLVCPKCGTPVYIGNRHELISRCLKALNRDIFKDATLIRLDDWYIPELKEKRSPSPNYRLTVYIKTDKDEDTIVVLYVSYVGSGNKVQYFIKPEKGQLTSDHKDMDPSKIISKIEVTLKDRKLSQEYDSE